MTEQSESKQELSRCPLCDCMVNWGGPKIYVWCSHCGFALNRKRYSTLEEAVRVWNQLCADIALGREVRKAIPEGWEFDPDSKIEEIDTDRYYGYIAVPFRPLPQPSPSKNDMLRKCRTALLRHEGLLHLVPEIDAALETEADKGDIPNRFWQDIKRSIRDTPAFDRTAFQRALLAKIDAALEQANDKS